MVILQGAFALLCKHALADYGGLVCLLMDDAVG